MDTYSERSTALFGFAASILVLARAKVPIDTGSLWASGRIDEYGSGFRVSFGAGNNIKNGNGINYATYVHEGHRGYDGAKYLSEAAEHVQNESISVGYPIGINLETNVNIDGYDGCMAVYIYEDSINKKRSEQIKSEYPGYDLDGEFGEVDTDSVGKNINISVSREEALNVVSDEIERLMGQKVREYGHQVLNMMNGNSLSRYGLSIINKVNSLSNIPYLGTITRIPGFVRNIIKYI